MDITILSSYTALQVFGFARSLSQRPIFITQNYLYLRYGILNEVDICLDNIHEVVLSRKTPIKNEFTQTLSPLGEVESHNLILYLKFEQELIGLYGLRKKFKVISFHIDNPNEFKENLELRLSKSEC